MNPHVRHAVPDDASVVSKLVQAGFAAYVARDWEASAREHFVAETSAETLAPTVAGAAFAGLYEDRGQALGVILPPRPTVVQLLFASRRSF